MPSSFFLGRLDTQIRLAFAKVRTELTKIGLDGGEVSGRQISKIISLIILETDFSFKRVSKKRKKEIKIILN